MKKHLAFTILIFIATFSAFTQISISSLKSAGINDAEDLKKLGISQNEIEKLKTEYLADKPNDQTGVIESNDGEINEGYQKFENIETPQLQLKSQVEPEEELIYGHSIFRNGSVNIQNNSDRIKASDNYLIGSGDILNITIWGFSEFSNDFTVDELGNISPKLVGRINLKGKSFKTAKSIISSRFSKVYDLKNSQIAIDLSYSKVIAINVMGDVVSPGTYSVPSINSAFNIISLAKGPNEKGSVRNIAVIRNGKIIEQLDIYNFISNPSKSTFYHLLDGDFIFIPAHGNIVSIDGEVIRKGKFEIKENETLSDLIKFAGGFNSLANQSSINIIRNTIQGRVMKSYSFDEASSVVLQNGDEVFVSTISSIISKKISVSGEVNNPGVFEFSKNESVFNLIKKVNGLTPQAYLKIAHIYRLNKKMNRKIIAVDLNNTKLLKRTLLEDLDEVHVFNKTNFLDTNYVQITGLIRNPGNKIFKNNMSLKDLFTLSDGALPQANLNRIEIERINFSLSKNDTTNYMSIITKNYRTDADFELQPYDIINVRSLPNFKFHQSIKIKGEVNYPGNYSLANNHIKTSDIIKRAGGLTNLAYGQKAYIYRTEDSIGLILLDLKLVLKNENSQFNYVLRPGDEIIVPKVNDIVSISGAIGAKFVNDNNINVPFTKRKSATYYLKKYAGGYDKKADKKHVYVITLNGQVKQSKVWGIKKPKVEKGDKIVIKYKPQSGQNKNREKINWNSQIESLTIKLTGITTLWILVGNAFQ